MIKYYFDVTVVNTHLEMHRQALINCDDCHVALIVRLFENLLVVSLHSQQVMCGCISDDHETRSDDAQLYIEYASTI